MENTSKLQRLTLKWSCSLWLFSKTHPAHNWESNVRTLLQIKLCENVLVHSHTRHLPRCPCWFPPVSRVKLNFIDQGKIIVITNYILVLWIKSQIVILIINAFLACFLGRIIRKCMKAKPPGIWRQKKIVTAYIDEIIVLEL